MSRPSVTFGAVSWATVGIFEKFFHSPVCAIKANQENRFSGIAGQWGDFYEQFSDEKCLFFMFQDAVGLRCGRGSGSKFDFLPSKCQPVIEYSPKLPILNIGGLWSAL